MENSPTPSSISRKNIVLKLCQLTIPLHILQLKSSHSLLTNEAKKILKGELKQDENEIYAYKYNMFHNI